MKKILFGTIMLVMSSCSVADVDPSAFLNQVKGRNILNEGTTTVAGSFTPSGETFNFQGGSIPFRLDRATSNNEAEYTARLLESVSRVYMTVNGSKIVIDVQNGTPAQTFDLSAVSILAD